MAFVNIQNLSKYYGDLCALNDASIDIEEGEFVAILGPSGSGKTTLLKMIAGFTEPSDGTIVVDGKDMTGLAPEDRDMSLLFQRLALFPHMSVYENIAFGLKHKHDFPKDEIAVKVEEALETVSLPGYGDRSIQNLSGGEQQRVALARALVTEPKLLLFDEPLSDLDRQLREKMRREIKSLHEEIGITTLYVTHNQREALTLSDRIVVIHNGEIVRYDTPSEIYQNPQTEFVAEFVGDSNFVSGSLVDGAGTTRFETEAFSFPVSENIDAKSNTEASDRTLYIRPEDITIGDEGDGQVTGTVADTVHLGSVTEYTVRLNGHSFLVVDLGPPAYEEDENVDLSFSDCGLIGSES